MNVKAKTNSGTYIDVEIQLQHTSSMPKRTLYYWSKMYSEQLSTGGSYDTLSKTVTINIMDYNCIPNNKKHNKFLLLEHETHEILTDVLEIHFLELSKLTDLDYKNIEQDELTKWMLFIQTPEKEVLEMLTKKNKEIKKAYTVLDAMSKSKTDRMLYEAREAAIHDQVTREKESFEKGRKSTQLEIAKTMKLMGMNDDEIMKITGLDLETLKKDLH